MTKIFASCVASAAAAAAAMMMQTIPREHSQH